MVRKLLAIGLVASLSCKREGPSPAPVRATALDAATATPSASASTAADVDPNEPLKDVATKWNDAINTKDITALGTLHDGNVRFYGVMVDNAAYCAKMSAALAKDPAFHQTIDAMRVDWSGTTRAKVSFRKKDGKAEHLAYLVLDKRINPVKWVITEESDLVTDANLKCVSSAEVTLTGTIEEGFFMWHDRATPTTVLALNRPICVDRDKGDEWAWGGEREDGVDRITLMTAPEDASKLSVGTKVRVHATHLQPHSGSGHYSTTLLAFAEITRL